MSGPSRKLTSHCHFGLLNSDLATRN
uniref:Uncharacterized protein n=1 Tax=Anguilla anguilla TaxID=7936 RepID=A0A0E9QFF9_ANGAN